MRNKILSVIFGLAIVSVIPSFGQGRGLDSFGVPRSIVLATPTQLLPVATDNVTNSSIDIHSFDGIAVIDLATLTNTPTAATLTAQIQTSVDNTNWTALQNYAVSTPASVSYSNSYYGSASNLVVTDNYVMPGTFSTVTTGTAGFAPPSSSLNLFTQAQFTNTAATITVTRSGFYKVGFNAADANRYLRIIWIPRGATNDVVSALFTGSRASEVQ